MKIRGITLVETLVYLAVLSTLIAASFVCAVSLAGAAREAQSEATGAEDAGFIESVIAWESDLSVGATASSTDIAFDAADRAVLHFDPAAHSISLSRGGTLALLTDQTVSAFDASTSGNDPQELRVTFFLDGTSYSLVRTLP